MSRSECFVMCLALVLLLCVVSTAHSEDFNVLLKRAERGDVEAQFQVGYRYAIGNGVKQDYKKAREYYEKAAAMNNAWAIFSLGVIY